MSKKAASGGQLGERKSSNGVDEFRQPDSISERVVKQVIVEHEPSGAPRMTQQDRWLGQPGRKPRRPAVQKYFDLRDAVRSAVGDMPIVPAMMEFVFVFTMPDSWSEKKRVRMDGQLHRQRPDVDNCIKGILDSLFAEDGSVAKIQAIKLWGRKGSLKIIY